jgi:hypothetical protein
LVAEREEGEEGKEGELPLRCLLSRPSFLFSFFIPPSTMQRTFSWQKNSAATPHGCAGRIRFGIRAVVVAMGGMQKVAISADCWALGVISSERRETGFIAESIWANG